MQQDGEAASQSSSDDLRRDGKISLLALPGPLVAKAWPSSRVLAGLRVCNWIRQLLQKHGMTLVLRKDAQQSDDWTQDTVFRDLLCNHHLKLELELSELPSLARQVWDSPPGECPEFTATVIAALIDSIPQGLSSRLVRLDLSGCFLLAEGVERLADAVGACHGLERLNLNRNRMCEGVEALAGALSQLRSLSHLDLQQNGIDALGGTQLAGTIGACTLLVHFEVGKNKLASAGLQAVANSLPGTITHLGVAGNSLYDEGAAVLERALPKWASGFASLDVGGNFLSQGAIAAVARGLERCSQLTQLGWQSNALAPQGARSLAAAFEKCGGVKHLSMLFSELDAEEASLLVAGVGGGLQTLELDMNRVGDAGATCIAPRLSCCTALRYLSLRSNDIGSAGALAVAEAVCSHARLTTLDLSDNPIFSGASSAAVARLLAATTGLRHLALESAGLAREHALALAHALAQASALESLNLAFNSIGSRGVARLMPALEGCSGLTALDLCGVGMGDDAATSLAGALQRWPRLTALHAYSNEVSDQGATALAAAGGSSPQVLLDLRSNAVDVSGGERILKAFGQQRVLLEGNPLEA